MSQHEPAVPTELIKLQQWFASIITRPIDTNSQMISFSPTGHPMIEEAQLYLTSNDQLGADQRIQIYNQQYWWRLLTVLQQNFPMLVRLFGYEEFNLTLAMPFLSKYPSQSWSLSQLGHQLSLWLEEHYQADDKGLVIAAAKVDWAHQSLFYARKPVQFLVSPGLFNQPLALQDHVVLFDLPFDLLSMREILLQHDVEYWLEHDFPVIAKERTYYFVLYRTLDNKLTYEEIEKAEWTLLTLLSQGETLDMACEQIEEGERILCERAEVHLQNWIKNWLRDLWIMPKNETLTQK